MEKDARRKACENIVAEKRALLRVGQELVLVDDGGHRQLAGGIAALDPHHAALATHSDTFRKRDFGRQGQGEIDRGTRLDGGIDIEADSACADVAGLRHTLRLILSVTDGYRQAKREAARGPLVIIIVLVLLGLGHRTSSKAKVSKFQGCRVSKTCRNRL